MKIINPGNEGDYHMHCMEFSDGLESIRTIVEFAGKEGYKEIWITDHSDEGINAHGYSKKCSRRILLDRWKNVFNDVNVSFGVEADLLDKAGNICDTIQDIPSEILYILSAHEVFKGKPEEITQAYLNAIEKHGNRIAFIGHPCANYFGDKVDIEKVVLAANEAGIALEVNGANLCNNKTNLEKLAILLRLADRVYVNSDAHTAFELINARKIAFKFLEVHGFYGAKKK